MTKVDYTTWCDDSVKAAIILAKILDERDEHMLTKKVNKYIHKFNMRVNELTEVNKTERELYLMLLYHHTRNNIRTNFDTEVSKFLSNVITATYRKKLREGSKLTETSKV